ncbi:MULTISPECIES: hypothetical protein [Candidatus Nitrosocaldus]|uniref:hypothetical protein n=1 Tax=Candidatus Nitrosocaldus TaxID=498374 RepID=UPI0011E5B484|nr:MULTISPECIES: hypothetical protein [Candidatus Nitrosocaldus]
MREYVADHLNLIVWKGYSSQSIPATQSTSSLSIKGSELVTKMPLVWYALTTALFSNGIGISPSYIIGLCGGLL